MLHLLTSFVIFVVSTSSACSDNYSSCSYVVSPNETCECLNHSHTQCETFSYFIMNQTAYFKSNTTFCFMSGTHILNIGLLQIENISNITFIGLGKLNQISVFDKVVEFNFDEMYDDDKVINFLEPSAIIKCENSSGLYMNNIDNLSLINITIVDCGSNVGKYVSSYIQLLVALATNVGQVHNRYAAVLIVNVTNIHMDTLSIQNSTGQGLMGVNVLGDSEIYRSSFVGNNQVVKRHLQFYHPPVVCVDWLFCSSCTSPFYVNNATNASSKMYYAGGNAVFIYTEISNNAKEPKLNVSHSLFALGIDGSLQIHQVIISMGTGLSVYSVQNMYHVHIHIDHTVTYRNQASFGSNLNFIIFPTCSTIALFDVNCTRAISYNGGLQYIILPYPLNGNPNSLILTDSTFSVRYNAYMGIYTNISSEPNMVMQVINCNIMTNFKIFASNSTNTPVLFVNTKFNKTDCSTGIAAYFSSLNVFKCSFNYCGIYGYESSVSFISSTISNSTGGGILLYNSHLSIAGNVSFINNSYVGNGGAISLYYTDVVLDAPVNISFINNTSAFNGGAIYIEYYTSYYATCMFSYNDSMGTLDNPGVHIYFEGNYAYQSGNMLYGGNIDRCIFSCSYPNCSNITTFLSKIATYQNNGNTSAMISSDSRQICGCTSKNINCTSANTVLMVYPGQTINIPIISVGQFQGASPDFVLFSTCDVDEDNMANFSNCIAPTVPQPPQQTLQFCTNYSYLVTGKNYWPKMSALLLVPRSYFLNGNNLDSNYNVFFKILPCPFGYVWNETSRICSCDRFLLLNGVQCDIDALNITRTDSMWVGKNSVSNLAVHLHCPYDYCFVGNVSFNLSDPDEQCINGHSGVLCGGCKTGLSVVFGSARCVQCSNRYLELIALISLMGIAIVTLIFLLNCTVSSGTPNGFILYANIVRPGMISLLPSSNQLQSSFLVVFIDWINLNFGIQSCFYNGMDTYSKTWLEFVFSLYILTLVVAIIIGSRWSSLLARLCKRNAVPVLATLILLSYTKCLSNILTIFTYVQLSVENSTYDNPALWLADSNVLFLRGRHVYLVVAGISISALFIIPYTSIMLLSPCLQAWSEWRLFSWVDKLKPFVDANQGPFKDRYRYWPGIQLMVRVVLYLMFAINESNDISINLLGTILVTMIYFGVSCRLSVHKNVFVNVIEAFLMLNISSASVCILFIISYNNSFNAISDVITASLASVFVAFLLTVAFHSYGTVKDLIKLIRTRKLSRPSNLNNMKTTAVYVHAPEPTEESLLLNYREPLIDE